MLSFLVGCGLLVIAVGFIRDTMAVLRGETQDKQGRPLWVYQVVKKKMPVAKDKKQALIMTAGSAFLCLLLGLLMVVSFLFPSA